MKKLFFLLVFFFATVISFAQSQVWVNGTTRSNGTYVPEHYRTAPDYTINNNWTTLGNVNPHTGKVGTLPRSTSYPNTYYVPVSTYTNTYTPPVYNSTPTNYNSAPSYSSTNTLYTGPRGGTYYINSSGNKSYVSRN